MKRVASNVMDVESYRYEGSTVIVAFERKAGGKPMMSLFMPITEPAGSPSRNDVEWFKQHCKEMSLICRRVRKDLQLNELQLTVGAEA